MKPLLESTIIPRQRRPDGSRRALAIAVFAAAIAGKPCAASAQGGDARRAGDTWTWSFEATIFAGENVQRGHALSTPVVFESQNWVSLEAARPIRSATLSLFAILSAETLTMHEFGSPQPFQISGPFLSAPIGNYESPRDLFSGLGASMATQFDSIRVRAEAALVGSPALGPPGYQQRQSASLNPQVPLAHGMIDATDASSSVVSIGFGVRRVTIEGSVFRGRELDDRRWDLEAGKPDSWALRGSYRQGAWTVQVSTGRLHRPHDWELFDATRTTASVGVDTPGGRLSFLAAWGQNRDRFGALDGYLVDAAIHLSPRDHVYLRGDRVRNDFSDGGYHSLNPTEVALLQTAAEFTVGYVRDIGRGFGIGADVNVYILALATEGHDTTRGYHVFLRLHARRGVTSTKSADD